MLDVGAGIGAVEERLPDYEFVGVAVSEPTIRTADIRADAGFLVGDVCTLPIEDGIADVVR